MLFNSKSKWDDLKDDDDDDDDSVEIAPDMTYVTRNIVRQNQQFVAIREADGPTNDIYVRGDATTPIFWFCGKVARISDVSLERCVSRQWPLIEQHAVNLRLELLPKKGTLQIWTAPGDSELDVAYNRPDVVMQQMERELPQGMEGSIPIKNRLVGFQGEIYDQGEEGFRAQRTDDGRPLNPEVVGAKAPSQDNGVPGQEELEELLKSMDGMTIDDVGKVVKEQERKEGREVEE